MKSDMEMKMALLDQLEELLLGSDGKQFGPKEEEGMPAALIVAEPVDEDEMEDEIEDELHAEPDGDEEEEMPRKKKSLREFMRDC